ncbi:MAG: hypothetical protein AAF226_08770 [Verrucomicrobiota bacterium]
MKFPNPEEDPTEIISDDARNGLITANGVILAFVLGFFVNFTYSDHQWRFVDLISMFLLLGSLILLTLALYRAFLPYRQNVAYFKRTIHWMIAGITSALLGAICGFLF